MVGGGLGSKYPEGARAEFMRRRREDMARRGGDALGDFQESRSPERFARLAEEAGVPGARVIPDALGCWLLFGKAVCG